MICPTTDRLASRRRQTPPYRVRGPQDAPPSLRPSQMRLHRAVITSALAVSARQRGAEVVAKEPDARCRASKDPPVLASREGTTISRDGGFLRSGPVSVPLKPGLYERIITRALSEGLRALEPEQVNRDRLDPADAHVALARHVYETLLRSLRAVPGS